MICCQFELLIYQPPTGLKHHENCSSLDLANVGHFLMPMHPNPYQLNLSASASVSLCLSFTYRRTHSYTHTLTHALTHVPVVSVEAH